MLQLFYMDVAKLDRDVVSICPQCFICFLDVCCKCVYMDVAYVSHMCCKCFICTLYKYFCKCCRRIFQSFHLSFWYIASVASGYFTSRSGVSYEMKREWASGPLGRAARVMFRRRGAAPHGCARRRHGQATSGRRRPTRGHTKTDYNRGRSSASSAVLPLNLVLKDSPVRPRCPTGTLRSCCNVVRIL
jgi:hypothetical protein